MAPRHFLDLDQIDAATLRGIVDAGHSFKRHRRDGAKPLAGRTLAMIFEKPSTRTRVSFEVGIRELGGDPLLLTPGNTQVGRGETIADTARVLSRYVDAIMKRTDSAERLYEMARHATIPVINGLTDRSHPCQALADVMTVEEPYIGAGALAWTGYVLGQRFTPNFTGRSRAARLDNFAGGKASHDKKSNSTPVGSFEHQIRIAFTRIGIDASGNEEYNLMMGHRCRGGFEFDHDGDRFALPHQPDRFCGRPGICEWLDHSFMEQDPHGDGGRTAILVDALERDCADCTERSCSLGDRSQDFAWAMDHCESGLWKQPPACTTRDTAPWKLSVSRRQACPCRSRSWLN